MGLDGAGGALDVTIRIQGLVVELLSTFLYTCVPHSICIHRFATIPFSLSTCLSFGCVCVFIWSFPSQCVFECTYACKSMLGMCLYAHIYISITFIYTYKSLISMSLLKTNFLCPGGCSNPVSCTLFSLCLNDPLVRR